MKRKLFRPEILLLLLGGATAQAQVVNYFYAHNYAAGGGGGQNYNDIMYVGPGAYPSATSSDIWNGFGRLNTAYGGVIWNTLAPLTPVTSTGAASTVTGAETSPGTTGDNGNTWGFGNGTGGNTLQGTPHFLLSYGALVNSGNPGVGTSGAPMGTFVLNGLAPGGVYDLYLYGANANADRGAVFSVSTGSAHSGINGTVNNGNDTLFVEGVTYVWWQGAVANGSGSISINWIPNPASTLLGEGNFNGVSVVAVPEPSTLGIIALGIGGLIFLRRRS